MCEIVFESYSHRHMARKKKKNYEDNDKSNKKSNKKKSSQNKFDEEKLENEKCKKRTYEKILELLTPKLPEAFLAK